MREQPFDSARTGDRCVRYDHPSGLPIYVWPRPGYRSTYAVFATRYGSIDTAFRRADGQEPVTVPAGIAHYLEHKLFESEEGNTFDRFAQLGASANAYTSFDRTAYLFTCTDRVEESLAVLLDFVQKPYFTPENVQKERGIIGQEIRMCEDRPSRRVLFDLLGALYHQHPVKIDIAGTVDSIEQITPELLYDCYRAFYNPRNMVLVVTGNVTAEQVLAVAERTLQPAGESAGPAARAPVEEPAGVAAARVEAVMPVAAPLFYLGYKDVPLAGTQGGSTQVCPPQACSPQAVAASYVLLDVLAGKASPLYTRLMDEGLINETFDAEFFHGPGYGAWLFGGESRDPDAVAAAIREEIARVRCEGIDPEAFRAAQRALYGRLVAGLNDVENGGDTLVDDYFSDRNPFALLDAAAGLDIQSVEDRLHASLTQENAALSIVRPA